jgi:hypothetical protein
MVSSSGYLPEAFPPKAAIDNNCKSFKLRIVESSVPILLTAVSRAVNPSEAFSANVCAAFAFDKAAFA